MSDSGFLERYTGAGCEERLVPNAEEGTPSWEDLGCFGWLRGIGERCVMLQCKR